MPTYDYRCNQCQKRFDLFLSYKEYGVRPVACPYCQSTDVRRRAPRVRILKGEAERLASLADPSVLANVDDDPQALGQMMRKMGSEMGEQLPPEFDEVVDRLEAGQSPDEISDAIPDLGEAGGGSEGGQDLPSLD